MSARSHSIFASKSARDDHFLGVVAEILERLRTESEKRSYPMLASLLEIARGQAADDLQTRAHLRPFQPNEVGIGEHAIDEDESLLRMAAKLATRGRLPRHRVTG